MMKTIIRPIAYLGELTLLLIQTSSFIFQRAVNLRLTVQQMALIGVNSLPIVLLTTAFTGMVISLQVAHEAVRFGGGKLVGGLVAVAMARELAPVLTGVVVAGRAGSAICAELGSMKVTEQIDALRAMATNPIQYLVVPRFLSCLIMLPVLTIFADIIGILGGYFIAVHFAGINPVAYYDSICTFLKLVEVFDGLIKSAIFGVIISLVGCLQGLNTTGGAAGVGRSTTNSVVICIILIFAANFFLSMLIFF